MIKSDLHFHTNFSDGESNIESMILSAIDRNVKNVAVSDHLSPYGHFLYSFSNSPKTIEEYLSEISRMRRKYRDQITIFPAVEISSDFLKKNQSSPFEDKLQDNLEYLSLFLIEAVYIREPVLTAINMRSYLNDLGFKHVPVIFAHPNYSSMNLATFKYLLSHDIGFELNENKLPERDAIAFIELIQCLNSEEKKKLKITTGSDAHMPSEIGVLDYVIEVVSSNNLENFLIIPPQVQDYTFV